MSESVNYDIMVHARMKNHSDGIGGPNGCEEYHGSIQVILIRGVPYSAPVNVGFDLYLSDLEHIGVVTGGRIFSGGLTHRINTEKEFDSPNEVEQLARDARTRGFSIEFFKNNILNQ